MVWTLTRIGLHDLFVQIGLLYQVLHFDFKPGVGIIISNRRLKMDEVPLPEYDLEDIDRESVIEYQAELRKNPKYESYSNLPIEKFLPLMGAYVKRRDGSNKYALTAGGLLFFGKYASIIQAFKNYQLEYYDMGNPLANERYTDRVSTLTDMLNIWQFFRKTFPKLLASVKGAFRLDEQLKRIDIGASLEVAVREALVNSLMHANYFIGSPTIISNKLNYYEFKNPGKMLVNKTDFFTKLTSKPRNSIISSLFVFIGMGERSGTGGGLIIKSALDIKARLPELEEDETQTTLKIWKVDYADSIDGEALDGKAKSVIKALTKRPKMSKSEIMKATKLTRTETDNRLKLLVEKEIILRQGRGRGTFYVMPISPSQALAQLEQTSEDLRKMFNHMTK
jgi:predicted HTH transcriptional regulator